MKNNRKEKVYTRIAFPILGLVLLICIIFVIIIGRNAVNSNREKKELLIINKISTITEEMCVQLNYMRQSVRRICISPKMKWENIDDDSYYEWEAIRFLQEIHDFYGIYQSCFVKYRDVDKVFVSSGYTCFSELYISEIMKMQEVDTILELLDIACTEKKKRLILYREEDGILFLFPMQVYSSSGQRQQGTVGFYITEENVLERMKVAVGEIPKELCITYSDYCIVGEDELKKEYDVVYGTRIYS